MYLGSICSFWYVCVDGMVFWYVKCYLFFDFYYSDKCGEYGGELFFGLVMELGYCWSGLGYCSGVVCGFVFGDSIIFLLLFLD